MYHTKYEQRQKKTINGKYCIQNMHERKIIEENYDVKWKFRPKNTSQRKMSEIGSNEKKLYAAT